MSARSAAIEPPARLVNRPFALVAFATCVFFVYVGIQVPLLPRLIEERLGGSEFDIGLNLAAFSLAAIFVRPMLSRFGERFGLRSMMIWGALLTTAATVASSLVMNRWGLLPLRGVQGVGEAGLFVGGASLISGFAPAHRRAEAASYFSVALFGGLGLGPIVGETVVGDDHFARGLLVAAAFALTGAAAAYFVPRTAPTGHTAEIEIVPGEERRGWRTHLHPAAVKPGLVLALGIGGYTSFASFIPEHSKVVGLSGSQWVFATYSVTCLVIRLVAAKVPERIGLARAVTMAMFGLAAGLSLLAVLPTAVGVFASAGLLALGMSFQYPSLMAMAVNAAPPRERLRVISTFTMFFEVGAVVGGLVLGAVAELTSKRGGFTGGAVFAGLGLLLLWRWVVPSLRPGPRDTIAGHHPRRGPRPPTIAAAGPGPDADVPPPRTRADVIRRPPSPDVTG